MSKYNWTEKEIDEQDFFSILDLETGEWRKKVDEERENPLVFIDELGF